MSFSSDSKKNGKTYYLHSRQQTLRGGATVTLYYFASAPGAGAVDALPEGYVVTENERTGLPLLKKAK
jgi:YHS domain-containing protein